MKRHLILFILTILPGSIYTHADNLRSISSREGISNNSVLSLAQGQDGYIWFGTCDGLDMWDGDRAAAYPAEDTGMLPLSGNLIEEIIKDGAISDANLRLLVDEIKIYESDKKLRIEINLKAKFTKHYEIYGESGVEHNLILQG